MRWRDTPIEKYLIGGKEIEVKREDLCCIGGPPFSKMRGIKERLKTLKHEGVEVVGYVETAISMAGWGVAKVGKELGLRVIIYDPQYKISPGVLNFHRSKWAENQAETRPIKAGRAKVGYYQARYQMEKEFGNQGMLLPLGLPFEETIEATAKEAAKLFSYRTVVVNVGSGTICAGLLRGLGEEVFVWGIMGRKGDKIRKREEIEKRSVKGLSLKKRKGFALVDPGYEYTESESFPAPFPCNPYYDRKAWKWVIENYGSLERPVLFWNIGA